MNTEALLSITQTLPGWMSVEKGRRIIELVTAAKAKRCVELGVFGGRSLVCLAFGLQILGSGRADGIDPFIAAAALEGSNDPANDEWWSNLDYDAVERAAQEALIRLNLTPNYAQIIRARSREVVGLYEDGSIDVLHQDSNHSEEVSSEEVALWTPKISPGGYWIFDDADWPSTQRAQRELVEFGFTEFEDHGGWKVYKNDKSISRV
jgi:hypothetical protein